MSSGSIGGVGQGLYQFFQSITASGGQSAAAAPPANSASGGDSSQPAQATPSVGGHHHHHHGHGQMAQQIQSAVTDALQSAQGDSSSDPNTVVQDAIEKVLKNAGAGGSSPSGQPTTSNAADSATDSSGAPANAGSSRQAFGQLLQSFGVDPQQFHNDFLAAIRDAQNGQVNSGTALKSFPPGSVIDETG